MPTASGPSLTGESLPGGEFWLDWESHAFCELSCAENVWYGGSDADHVPASVETGGIRVVARGTVLIGIEVGVVSRGREPRPNSLHGLPHLARPRLAMIRQKENLMPVNLLKGNFIKINSIRTRSAFDVGTHEQGAHVTYLGSDDAAARAGW